MKPRLAPMVPLQVMKVRGTVLLLLGLLMATSVPARGQVEATVTPFVAALFTDDSGIGGSLDTAEVLGSRAGVVIGGRVRIEGEVAFGETIRRSTVVFGNRAPTLGSRLVGASQIRDEIDFQAVGVNATWLLPVGPVELGLGLGVGRMWLLPDMSDRDNHAELVAATPVASPIAHVALHVTAVLHAPASELYLPPHREVGRGSH